MKKSSNLKQAGWIAQGKPPSGGRPRQPRAGGCALAVHDVEAVAATRATLPDVEQMAEIVELFAVLSNSTRVRILLSLDAHSNGGYREHCVCDLAAVAGASVSMTSHQLRLLRQARLVETRREGKLSLYRLASGSIGHLLRDALEYAATGEESVAIMRERIAGR